MTQPRFWTTKIEAGTTAIEIGEILRKGCKRYATSGTLTAIRWASSSRSRSPMLDLCP